MLSQTYLLDCIYEVIPSTGEAARLAEEEARKAITIDPDDPTARIAMAGALLMGGNYSAALEHADRALVLNRNSAAAFRSRASALVLMGQCPEGRADALTSLRLNPRDPLGAVTVGLIAASYYREGDYQSTVEVVRRGSPQYPDLAIPRRYLVAALGQLGLNEEAAAALRELQTKWPSNFRSRPAYLSREHYEHMLEGLRKAGWQG
jgi:adenylate cyclase